MRIATIKDLVNVRHLPPSRDMRLAFFKGGLKQAKKQGIAVHNDGRCYVPESQRGRGVGYNGKRRANRSDGLA